MKLPIDLCEEFKSYEQKIIDMQEKALDRLDYIIKTYFKTFGIKINSDDWWFTNSINIKDTRDNISSVFTYSALDYIANIGIEPRVFNGEYNRLSIVDKFEDYLSIDATRCNFIPIRWFFEDFEDEVIVGKKLFDKDHENEYKKEKDKVEQIKIAKSKLTIKERELLGIK